MRRILFLILFTLTGTIVLHAQESTDTDGIPANCESVSSYANPLLFPRYANGTLALINWSSGEAALILEQNSTAPNFWFIGWSPDCHYLAGGLGDGERYTTIIWDALTGARIGTVEDAFRRPHFLTWSPRSDALVVETRNGAFLWGLVSGTRLQLTIDAFYARSFHWVTWDYEAGVLNTFTMSEQNIQFSLATGLPTNVTVAANQYPTSGSMYHDSIVTAPNVNAPYGCVTESRSGFSFSNLLNAHVRVSQGVLIVWDEVTGETLQVLDEDFSMATGTRWRLDFLSPTCEYFFATLYMERERYLREGVVIRLRDGARIHSIPNMGRMWTPDIHRYLQPTRNEWDRTGRYFFVQSYDGAQIWDNLTDSTFYVTTPEESAHYGFSVDAITWDIPNGRATLDMLYSRENRLIDLATGQRVS